MLPILDIRYKRIVVQGVNGPETVTLYTTSHNKTPSLKTGGEVWHIAQPMEVKTDVPMVVQEDLARGQKRTARFGSGTLGIAGTLVSKGGTKKVMQRSEGGASLRKKHQQMHAAVVARNNSIPEPERIYINEGPWVSPARPDPAKNPVGFAVVPERGILLSCGEQPPLQLKE